MDRTQPGRLRSLALTIGAVLTMLFVGVGVATPAAAGGPGHKEQTVRVLLLERDPFVGNGANPQPGDVLLFQEPAVDADGQVIGDAITRVQVFQEGSYMLDCTVRLAEGNLVFSGAELFEHIATESTFAVTGGTGRYSGAGGQVSVTPGGSVQGQPADLLTFHLKH
ncbi:hypothetical protein GCM10010193_29000 [Kitasatospora atroaurantiaca]|uniref:Dirigent-like protein n=1 Tax=Kitasatospora atroaurantiaca TaxID=285545 RepID=A0A561EIV8_9ACTN|nr:hypothetical protein [Kitasatospora atroaurantiaca]TWE15548.1 hypothetical protein FB465_0448 [Kitasatospora atroaurantiaca]